MPKINMMKANEIHKKEHSFWIEDIEVVLVLVVVVVVFGVVDGVVGVMVDVDAGIVVVDVVGGSSLSQIHS